MVAASHVVTPMNSSESIDVVTNTLTVCADTLGDIVPAVYGRFFSLNEAANRLMMHSDQYMRGRMFEQVLELLLSDEHFSEGGYLDWELNNHLDAYKATVEMYEAFFEAVQQIVRENVRESKGSDWTDRETAAWKSRIDQVLKRVTTHAAETVNGR